MDFKEYLYLEKTRWKRELSPSKWKGLRSKLKAQVDDPLAKKMGWGLEKPESPARLPPARAYHRPLRSLASKERSLASKDPNVAGSSSYPKKPKAEPKSFADLGRSSLAQIYRRNFNLKHGDSDPKSNQGKPTQSTTTEKPEPTKAVVPAPRRIKAPEKAAGGANRQKKVRGKENKAKAAEAAKPIKPEILPKEDDKPSGQLVPPRSQPKTIDITARNKDPKMLPPAGSDKNAARSKHAEKVARAKNIRNIRIKSKLRQAPGRVVKGVAGSFLKPGGLGRASAAAAFIPPEMRQRSKVLQAFSQRPGDKDALQVTQDVKSDIDAWKEKRARRAERRAERERQLAAHTVYDRIGDLLGESTETSSES